MVKEESVNTSVFSFFTGAGFLDLGFEFSGHEVVLANEISDSFLDANIFARNKLNLKKPRHGYHNCDIRAFLEDKESFLAQKVSEERQNKRIVGFIGGPPCPDFSVGGKNKGADGKNGVLSKIYIDLIKKHTPDFFLFENVKGLWRTKRHREYYESLKKELIPFGYFFVERLVNSIEYGAPQDRERIILIGFRDKLLDELKIKKPEFGPYLSFFPWSKGIVHNEKSIFNQNWPIMNEFSENSVVPIPEGLTKELTIQYWFQKNDVEKHPNRCDFFQARSGLPKMMKIKEGDDSKKSFKRLHRWRYSPTACYGNNEVHLHPYYPRRISVSEALAIQSLPKEFELPSNISLTDKFKMIGNGVPFLMSKGIAQSILSFISTKDTSSRLKFESKSDSLQSTE